MADEDPLASESKSTASGPLHIISLNCSVMKMQMRFLS
jgi:hypothetical protein